MSTYHIKHCSPTGRVRLCIVQATTRASAIQQTFLACGAAMGLSVKKVS
jgi:hypothetical protein